MKTTLKLSIGLVTISSLFLNNKVSGWSKENYNNHKITVFFNGKKTSFEFWNSIQGGEMSDNSDLLGALNCFFNDAISGNMSFDEFCSEFGYDEDSSTAERVHKTCIKSLKKVENIFDCDLYDLANDVSELENN